MCLEVIYKELTNELKSSKEDIIGYKIIGKDYKSIFYGTKWKLGLNRSNRLFSKITKKELESNKIYLGFHIFKNEPTEYPISHMLIKLKIKPKDIVAVGFGSLKSIDIIATKATWIED